MRTFEPTNDAGSCEDMPKMAHDVGNGPKPRLVVAFRMGGVGIGEPPLERARRYPEQFGEASLRKRHRVHEPPRYCLGASDLSGRCFVDDVAQRLADALEPEPHALASLVDVVVAESLEAHDSTSQQRFAEVGIDPPRRCNRGSRPSPPATRWPFAAPPGPSRSLTAGPSSVPASCSAGGPCVCWGAPLCVLGAPMRRSATGEPSPP